MGFGEQRDRYQPETRLEAGLGGERWIAIDRVSGTSVVLGVLDARAATDAHRATFEAFRVAASTIGHPSLEKLVDSGETALGNPFFAVERTEGETLAQRLEREPAMSVHELVRVATAIVDGLVIAHKAGLVHGDIAPDRIQLLGGGRARLLGFGLNRAVARSLASSREAPTLPPSDAFMSPEQARGHAATMADDLWGIAAVLYRGVTGQAPRAKDDGRSTVANIVDGPTRPTVSLRPDLPASFGQLLDRALGDDPTKRFKDAAELRKALTSALILAPTVARLPVVAFPRGIAGPGTGGIDTQAPALPPPPTRSRTGIGPIGARESGEFSGLIAIPKELTAELQKSASSPLIPLPPSASNPNIPLPPSASNPNMPLPPARPIGERGSSAPPPLPVGLGGAPKSAATTTPMPAPSAELEELEDFDEATPSEEFTAEDALKEALAAEAAHAAASSPIETLAQPAQPAQSALNAPAIASAPPAEPSQPTAPIRMAPPVPLHAIPSAPSPTTAKLGVEVPRAKPVVVIEQRRTEPIVPAKGWAAIVLFALGVFVAAAGGFRLLAVHDGHATTPAVREPAADVTPTATQTPPVPAVTTPVQVDAWTPPAAVDAGAPEALDAGTPPPPAVEPPPVVTPPPAPRPTSTVAPTRTPRATMTTSSAASTSTSMTTVTMATMTTATMTTTPTLARDPGF